MIKNFRNKVLLGLFILISLCSCSMYNYSNWKKVEIPTDTPLRGKIKIPNEWEFISEDGIITLINQEGNYIVAKQIFQEWKFKGSSGGIHVDNWDDLEFKSDINDVDFKKEDYYTFTKGNSSPAYIYTFNDSVNERLCLFIDIYLDLSEPAKDTKTGIDFGSFYLGLMFNEHIEFETIYQMAVSYSWGGSINQLKY